MEFLYLKSPERRWMDLPSKTGGTVNLTWRMGAGATDICTTIIVDNNKNRRWDCGVDEMNFECPPSVKYMWDFIVE